MPEPREEEPRASESRSSRGRTLRARRDRRHQWTVVGIAVVTGLIAGSLGTTRGHSARALEPSAATTLAPQPKPARAILIGHVNASRRLDLLAVAGFDAGGHVGSVVFVPTATLVQVPAFDNQPISDVLALGKQTLLATTVANALGLRFDAVFVLTDDRLTTLLAPAKKLDVDFHGPVEVNDSAGTLAYTAGRARVSSTDATRLLLGPTTGGSLEHLVTVQAVLEGWFRALRDPAVARATNRVSRGAPTFVTLAHSNINFDTLPVTTLSSGAVTRYELQEPEADRLVGTDFPYAQIAKGTRPRVEILNGTGAIALTQAVARRVVPAGGEITITGNVPGFGVKHTSVVYYRTRDLPAAKRVAAALGVGSVALGNIPLDVIDLTVVVGSDFHPKRH